MLRRLVLFAASLCFGVAFISGSAEAKHHSFEPGAPGLGDEYFPLDGNGGYDVKHYELGLAYDPATGHVDRRGNDRSEGDPEPVELQPRSRRPDGPRRSG